MIATGTTAILFGEKDAADPSPKPKDWSNMMPVKGLINQPGKPTPKDMTILEQTKPALGGLTSRVHSRMDYEISILDIYDNYIQSRDPLEDTITYCP